MAGYNNRTYGNENNIPAYVCPECYNSVSKCKNAYEPTSYVYYLQGKVEKPRRITDIKPKPVPKTEARPEPKLTPQQEMRSKEYQDALDELFKL